MTQEPSAADIPATPASPGQDLQNRRREPRTLTLQTAKIVTPASQAPMVCAILNSSDSGASLLVPQGAEVPDEFMLAIDSDATLWSCSIVWRDDCRIGVRRFPLRNKPHIATLE